MKTCVSSYSFSKYMKETGCDLIAVATKAKQIDKKKMCEYEESSSTLENEKLPLVSVKAK